MPSSHRRRSDPAAFLARLQAVDGGEISFAEEAASAALTLAYPELDCVIVDKDRREAFADAFVENFQRVDLSRLETLRAFARMEVEFGWSAYEIARRLGRDRSDVASQLRVAHDERQPT